jgi:deoxyribose-phosphate aldolase
MQLYPNDIAGVIDISAVQAPNGEAEIRELAEYAKQYGFKGIHALPCWITFLRELMGDRKDILIGGPVGFPSGGHTKESKVQEARQMIGNGAREIDLMINVGMLRSGRHREVEDEIKAVVGISENVPVKVILEVYHLSNDEIKKACELCINAAADFVKTSTGWAPAGGTLEVVALITSFVGDAIKVKAAGGIHDLQMFKKMYALGVARFGINARAAVNLLQQCAELPGGVIAL